MPILNLAFRLQITFVILQHAVKNFKGYFASYENFLNTKTNKIKIWYAYLINAFKARQLPF